MVGICVVRSAAPLQLNISSYTLIGKTYDQIALITFNMSHIFLSFVAISDHLSLSLTDHYDLRLHFTSAPATV